MRNIIVLLLMSVAVQLFATAQEKTAAQVVLSQDESWQGFLVDEQYAETISKDPATVMQKASDYSRNNAKEKGSEAGFGILAKGEWLKFDAEGDKQARAIVQNSARDRGYFVTVLGKRDGNTIQVTSIEESTGSSPPQMN